MKAQQDDRLNNNSSPDVQVQPDLGQVQNQLESLVGVFDLVDRIRGGGQQPPQSPQRVRPPDDRGKIFDEDFSDEAEETESTANRMHEWSIASRNSSKR